MNGSSRLSRRDWLKSAAACTAALAIGAPTTTARQSATAATPADRRRVLRIAHLTDPHIQPERKAEQGVIACLRHVQSQPDKPDLILTGGDSVFDCFEQDHARTKLLWELWKRVITSECSIPVESCLGNHDVWGWNKKKSRTTGDEPAYGKKWAMEMFGVSRPYRSFDRAGWHVVILDSVFPDGDGYIGRLDDEQFEWFASDLAAVDATTPVLVLSHIPILSVAALANSRQEQDRDWKVSPSVMHTDAKRIRALFQKHANVKACLSGHLHLVERVEFEGVAYLCNGAVSGNWWKGRHQHCDEGYALVDLHSDGTVENRYVTFGWNAAT